MKIILKQQIYLFRSELPNRNMGELHDQNM